MSASSTRLNAMATERAATMQTTIHASLIHRASADKSGVPPSQQRAGESKRQCEHGVLKLDHLEREPNALKKVGNQLLF